jgi:hypothetical protein
MAFGDRYFGQLKKIKIAQNTRQTSVSAAIGMTTGRNSEIESGRYVSRPPVKPENKNAVRKVDARSHPRPIGVLESKKIERFRLPSLMDGTNMIAREPIQRRTSPIPRHFGR